MRVQWIDSLKGFLIVLVVLGHVVQSMIDSNVFYTSNYVLVPLFYWIYSFHMPLFFLVSGYVYRHSWDKRIQASNFWSLLLKKQINLIVLYFQFSLLLGGLKIFAGGNVKESVDIYDLLMIPFNPISVFWFLHVLIIFFFIFPCLDRLHYNYTNYKSLGLLLILSCFSQLVILPLDLNKICTHMFFFALGCLFYKSGALPSIKYIVVLLVFSLLLLNSWPGNVMLKTMVSVSWVLFFYVLFILKENIISNKVLILLGQECLAIYLLHPFLVAIYKFLMLKRTDSAVIYCLIGTLLSISIIMLGVYAVKKMGWYDYIFNLGGKLTVNSNIHPSIFYHGNNHLSKQDDKSQ
mgnify:FL=1